MNPFKEIIDEYKLKINNCQNDNENFDIVNKSTNQSNILFSKMNLFWESLNFALKDKNKKIESCEIDHK